MDCVVLEFSNSKIEVLADKLADELFGEIYDCAIRQYPWEHPLVPSMEALGEKVLRLALHKFYRRCS